MILSVLTSFDIGCSKISKALELGALPDVVSSAAPSAVKPGLWERRNTTRINGIQYSMVSNIQWLCVYVCGQNHFGSYHSQYTWHWAATFAQIQQSRVDIFCGLTPEWGPRRIDNNKKQTPKSQPWPWKTRFVIKRRSGNGKRDRVHLAFCSKQKLPSPTYYVTSY